MSNIKKLQLGLQLVALRLRLLKAAGREEHRKIDAQLSTIVHEAQQINAPLLAYDAFRDRRKVRRTLTVLYSD